MRDEIYTEGCIKQASKTGENPEHVQIEEGAQVADQTHENGRPWNRKRRANGRRDLAPTDHDLELAQHSHVRLQGPKPFVGIGFTRSALLLM